MPVLREVLNNDTALLVSPDAPEAWIEALDRLQNDSVLLGRLQQQAYNEFLRNYTWNQRAVQIINWVTARIRKRD
jgi:glycosyltransferase involved in cell wall biosynthesis